MLYLFGPVPLIWMHILLWYRRDSTQQNKLKRKEYMKAEVCVCTVLRNDTEMLLWPWRFYLWTDLSAEMYKGTWLGILPLPPEL